jgi:hypothetical protein
LPVQPHPQIKTLDDLNADAEQYANFCMSRMCRVTPELFLIGPPLAQFRARIGFGIARPLCSTSNAPRRSNPLELDLF